MPVDTVGGEFVLFSSMSVAFYEKRIAETTSLGVCGIKFKAEDLRYLTLTLRMDIAVYMSSQAGFGGSNCRRVPWSLLEVGQC